MDRLSFYGGLVAAVAIGVLIGLPTRRASTAEVPAEKRERYVGRVVDGIPFCEVAEITDTQTGRKFLVNAHGGFIEVSP